MSQWCHNDVIGKTEAQERIENVFCILQYFHSCSLSSLSYSEISNEDICFSFSSFNMSVSRCLCQSASDYKSFYAHISNIAFLLCCLSFHNHVSHYSFHGNVFIANFCIQMSRDNRNISKYIYPNNVAYCFKCLLFLLLFSYKQHTWGRKHSHWNQ